MLDFRLKIFAFAFCDIGQVSDDEIEGAFDIGEEVTFEKCRFDF